MASLPESLMTAMAPAPAGVANATIVSMYIIACKGKINFDKVLKFVKVPIVTFQIDFVLIKYNQPTGRQASKLNHNGSHQSHCKKNRYQPLSHHTFVSIVNLFHRLWWLDRASYSLAHSKRPG